MDRHTRGENVVCMITVSYLSMCVTYTCVLDHMLSGCKTKLSHGRDHLFLHTLVQRPPVVLVVWCAAHS